MDFTPYLDFRSLSQEAETAVAVGQALLAGEDITSEEVSEANHTLRSLSNLLKSLGYQSLPAEEYADLLIELSNNAGVTLVREDTIGEYWKDAALDFGRLNADQHEEFAPVIDWDAYARNQDSTVVNFALPASYGLNVKEINYYIF